MKPYYRENQRVEQKLGRKRGRKKRAAEEGKHQQEEKYRATAVRQRRKPGHIQEAESWRGQGSAIQSVVTGRRPSRCKHHAGF